MKRLFFLFLFITRCLCIADVKVWQCDLQIVELPFIDNENVTAIELPSDLIISPGYYTFKNKKFMVEKGCLRVSDIPYKNEQRLIWNGNLYSFLSGLTWMHTHGYRDVDKNYQQSLEICKKDKLFKVCGGISIFAKKLLENLDIPTRLICFLTLQPWNSYDNGHSCIEVFWDGKWQLFDIDLKQVITINDEIITHIPLVQEVFFLEFYATKNVAMLSYECSYQC